MKNIKPTLIIFACLFAISSFVSDSSAGAPNQYLTARKILDATGIQGGFIVHIGCGDGKLTAALRAGESYLVHGLDKDAKNVEQARVYIQSLGIYGKVSVEQWSGKALPYNDNVVNLLVAENPGDISMDEVMRVLCPNGMAYLKQGHEWKKIIKPRPSNIDEWTHFLHSANNNAVAKDARVATPNHLQWEADPKRTRDHDAQASISAMTSSNGRIFYILDEGLTSLVHHPAKWKLIARDAFNGKLLWKRDIGSWITHLRYFRSGPVQLPRLLVSVGDRVYVTVGFNAPVSMLDAATGKTIHTYEGSEKTEELICHDDILLTVIGDSNIMNEEAPKIYGYWELSIDRKPDIDKSIVAYKANTSEILWKKTGDNLAYLVPLSLAACKDRVFFLDNESLHCISLKTGNDLWSAPLPTKGLFLRNYAPTVVAYDDVVMCLTFNRLCSFSSEDGKKLWEHKGAIGFASPGDLFVIDGLAWTIPMTASIWSGNKLDAKGKIRTGIPIPRDNFIGNGGNEIWGIDIHTGQVKRSFNRSELLPGGHHHRCYRNKATERYLICGRRGLEYIDLAGDNHINNWWLRGICQYGVMPCNGLIYVPPQPCQCFNDIKFDGFHALAAQEVNINNEREGREQLVKGDAYGNILYDSKRNLPNTTPLQSRDLIWTPPVPNTNLQEWPTYRHDMTRSGCASTKVPVDLTRKWKTKIGGTLSSVVVARKKLLVSAVDRQMICCLDAEKGTQLWTFTAEGRVDSPPTVYRGMAIFGCRNGYVYALRISDGELVWRFRGAPLDRRTVVRDRLESLWPIHGSVLVVNDTVYFVAGYSSYLDGGIRLYGLDAGSGKVKCSTKLSSDGASKDGALPDVLISDGRNILMRRRCFDLSLKAGKRPKLAMIMANTGLLEDCWGHRWNWELGGGDTFGKLLVFDEQMAYGIQTYYTFLKSDTSMQPDTHTGHLHQKYARYTPDQFPIGTRLFARENKRREKRESNRRQRRTLNANSHRWNRKALVQFRAMVLSDDALFAAGWKDSVRIFEKEPYRENDSVLAVMSAADGEVLKEYSLETEPVFDGMAAAYGKLYLSLKDGSVVCLGGK
ncbi:MAG: PQQ-binding-like beta-propeller repeat protein [Phycisphaerae bacterium]|nr:PQQ-binding-like beta-propeller repeat protein [Phycisphaerae bacterium]NIP50886.1 PQQ-binding-like beta-propeller repeat protein [Phycisphaerae bacterium]NIS50082.1 PQQ-binding-like beta-propeller repeat protein [Phycisphaerae bacterium]NIU07737.1 PQQ-binding-like beta-propeller repeat protein [Phycisphaerae bacterium]NIU55361.1 PQQ-binding-like beta-propeller repeat protein [Phycisphaerae bacterium]